MGQTLTVLARLAIRLIVLAVIIGIVAAIVPGIHVTADSSGCSGLR